MCSEKRAGSTEQTGDHAEFDLGAIAGVTDRGHLHAHNEDAIALGTRGGVSAAVVCDGVSSTRNPERASLAAADAALDALLAVEDTGPEQRVRDAITAATDAVHGLAPPGSNDDPSCTIVAAVVEQTGSGRPTIAVAWIGDSRAYWLAGPDAAEPARRLTEDHSWASEVVAAGLLDEEAAQAHPRAHIITRWLGPRDDHKPGVTVLSPAGPGALLLCSDGLWNYCPEAADLAGLANPVLDREPNAPALRAATAMATLALDAGGRDNITVAVLGVR